MHIKTERLELREFSNDDVKNYHGLESIPEVVRYQTWPPRTLPEAATAINEIIHNQNGVPRTHVELAVLQDGRFIGRVGTMIKNETANLWYSFLPSAQGKGYATEAMRAFVSALGEIRLEIECDPRNVGSCKVAERLGFTKESYEERAFECKGEWVGSVVYVRPSP